MINKEVKSSERESNNYTRATAIDLKTIDSEVALLSGRATQTPIGMKELWDEVQNLKATAKSWEIVTLSKSSGKFVCEYIFDSKYSDWNFAILSAFAQGGNENIYVPQISLSNNTLKCTAAQGYLESNNFQFVKSGNKIIVNNVAQSGSTLTVLFYK